MKNKQTEYLINKINKFTKATLNMAYFVVGGVVPVVQIPVVQIPAFQVEHKKVDIDYEIDFNDLIKVTTTTTIVGRRKVVKVTREIVDPGRYSRQFIIETERQTADNVEHRQVIVKSTLKCIVSGNEYTNMMRCMCNIMLLSGRKIYVFEDDGKKMRYFDALTGYRKEKFI